jgi:Leucine-rich repeat (LRR) protein
MYTCIFVPFISDLSHNKIVTTSDLSSIAGLKELYMTHNFLSTKSVERIADLQWLTLLDLSDNNISDLKVFSYLSHLTELNLSNNQVEIIEGLEAVPQLAVLHLAGNRSRAVNITSTLPSLTQLTLSDNQITAFAGISGRAFPSLKILSVDNNKIQSFADCSGLKSLVKLTAANNAIRDSGSVLDLPHLEILDVSGNLIEGLAAFSLCSKLSQLFLFRNRVAVLRIESKLENLVSLDMSSNQITTIVPFASNVPNLQLLDLSNNLIKAAEDIVDAAPVTLTLLDLRLNPLNAGLYPKCLAVKDTQFDSIAILSRNDDSNMNQSLLTLRSNYRRAMIRKFPLLDMLDAVVCKEERSLVAGGGAVSSNIDAFLRDDRSSGVMKSTLDGGPALPSDDMTFSDYSNRSLSTIVIPNIDDIVRPSPPPPPGVVRGR